MTLGAELHALSGEQKVMGLVAFSTGHALMEVGFVGGRLMARGAITYLAQRVRRRRMWIVTAGAAPHLAVLRVIRRNILVTGGTCRCGRARDIVRIVTAGTTVVCAHAWPTQHVHVLVARLALDSLSACKLMGTMAAHAFCVTIGK